MAHKGEPKAGLKESRLVAKAMALAEGVGLPGVCRSSRRELLITSREMIFVVPRSNP